ncbi:MAG: hypothetical protein AB1730_17890 [Myxococcota bacterium]
MSWTPTAVVCKQDRWTVEVESTTGEAAELQYPSEAQARYFAAVLSLGPASLPRDAIVRRLAALPEAPAVEASSPRRRVRRAPKAQ